jgi:hypothetical protein
MKRLNGYLFQKRTGNEGGWLGPVIGWVNSSALGVDVSDENYRLISAERVGIRMA